MEMKLYETTIKYEHWAKILLAFPIILLIAMGIYFYHKENSMDTNRAGKNLAIAVIRWSARVLGVIMASFFLFMFIGQLLEPYPSSEPIEPIAAIGLALMGIYAVAMFLALKWERLGSLLGMAGLVGVFVILFLGLFPNAPGGFSPGKGVLNPLLLALWLPILLYLLCWGVEKRLR